MCCLSNPMAFWIPLSQTHLQSKQAMFFFYGVKLDTTERRRKIPRFKLVGTDVKPIMKNSVTSRLGILDGNLDGMNFASAVCFINQGSIDNWWLFCRDCWSPLQQCSLIVYLWWHESEIVYGDPLVDYDDLAKFKIIIQNQARKAFCQCNQCCPLLHFRWRNQS